MSEDKNSTYHERLERAQKILAILETIKADDPYRESIYTLQLAARLELPHLDCVFKHQGL